MHLRSSPVITLDKFLIIYYTLKQIDAMECLFLLVSQQSGYKLHKDMFPKLLVRSESSVQEEIVNDILLF